MKATTRRQFMGTVGVLSISSSLRAAAGDEAIGRQLVPIREKYGLPALAGAIVTGKGVLAKAAAGVRKSGADVAATADDLWHLGSNTKAMTATLAGLAVETGKLRWDSTAGEVFPKAGGVAKSPLAGVTLMQLLTHRAGLPPNLKWQGIKDRDEVLRQAAALKLASAPGAKFEYSNLGYVLAGHMVEQVLGGSWEELMRERIFKPLGMTRAGFGGTGTPGRIDQPWPHLADGRPASRNGPATDNPPVMGPAGVVHATLDDWGLFVAEHLRGAQGAGALLKAATYQQLHTPPAGATYAGGWGAVERKWGGGTVLTHAGSNTMNKSVAWLAPKKDFAVLVCTNRGGDDTTKACDEAASALIRAHGMA